MQVKTVNIFLVRVIIKNTRLSVNKFFSYYLLQQTGALVGVIYLMLNVQSELYSSNYKYFIGFIIIKYLLVWLLLFAYIFSIYLMEEVDRNNRNYHLFLERLHELGINERDPNLDEITRVLVLQSMHRFALRRRRGYNSQDFPRNVRFNQYGLYIIYLRAESNYLGLNSIGLQLDGNRVRYIRSHKTAIATAEFIAFQYSMSGFIPANEKVNH
uniref:Uncharacterized protein n=1 Tax=Juglanconis juglandina TaxID=1940567 RepID=A0A291LJE2_9PEZI|nr:hypothetical protein [Juglanconis juglandina]